MPAYYNRLVAIPPSPT